MDSFPVLLDSGLDREKWMNMWIGASGFLDVGEPLPGLYVIKRIERLVVTEYIESGAFAENGTTERGMRTRSEGCDTDFTSNREQPCCN